MTLPALSPRPSRIPPPRSQLLLWQQQGNQHELARACAKMRWSWLLDLWIGFGILLGHVISPLMMSLVYLTLFLPFGLIGRLTRSPRGWIAVRRASGQTLAALRAPA